MSVANRNEAGLSLAYHPPAEAAAPDPSWAGMYRAGGISAILYILIGLVLPALMIAVWGYDFDMHGGEFLAFIAANKLWFTVFQTMVLGASVLAPVVFAALFLALKHVDKGLAALGAIVASTMQILFAAYYPVLLGLVYLGDQYVAAPSSGQAVFVTAAEALIAQNGAFNPLYESVFAVSILIVSLVMLKGVFPKWLGYLGIVTCAAAFVGLALWPVVGVAYFWWWLPFSVWFIAIGVRLIRLGGAGAE
jgi:hypothetical protein